jgi:hypothetical protein
MSSLLTMPSRISPASMNSKAVSSNFAFLAALPSKKSSARYLPSYGQT